MRNPMNTKKPATFECFNCHAMKDIKHAVECCACEFTVCSDCSNKKQCACNVMTRHVPTLVN